MNQGSQHIVNASADNIPLPSGMFHNVTTSPPYYSLRQYSGEQETDWPAVDYAPMPGLAAVSVPAMRCALGLEPTPEAYIGHLVLVFREVWRVLRADGCCWIVMGDSFANDTKWGGTTGGKHVSGLHGQTGIGQRNKRDTGLNPGDLMLIPARLALALQADGWTIRNDPPWVKLAPMPESCSGWNWQRHRIKADGDEWTTWRPCPGCPRCEATGGYVLRRGSWRHTRAHETVIMATKGMGYYADQERVREPSTGQTGAAADFRRTTKDHLIPGQAAIQHRLDREPTSDNGGRNSRTNLTADDELWAAFLSWYYSAQDGNPPGVLTPKPESYPGSHYAVFPSTLIAPLIRATCPTRCCPVCGAGWAPVVERSDPVERPDNPNPALPYTADSGHTNATGATTLHKIVTSTVTGYRATCSHDAEPVPGWVLDPFCGSGTTLGVARELGLNAVGLDISLEYLDAHVKPRIGQTPSTALDDLPLFAAMEELDGQI